MANRASCSFDIPKHGCNKPHHAQQSCLNPNLQIEIVGVHKGGFGMVKICDKYEHDRMIAHTSQLCHVVSNCYVKSPSSPNHKGFSAGSYRDMIRVAGVNEVLWTDLFLTNRDALLEELDIFVSDLLKVRNALANRDEEEMKRLLKQGRLIREKIVE